MELVKIEGGKITEYISTNDEPPKGKEWKEVDGAIFDGFVGLDEAAIDWGTGKTHPLEKLIADGLVEDNRGPIFNKKTGSQFSIKDVGVKVLDEFTKIAPDSPYDKWTGDAWEKDSALEAAAIKAKAIGEARQFLEETNNEADEATESGIPLIEFNNELYLLRKAARELIKNQLK